MTYKVNNNMFHGASPQIFANAKKLRNEMTEAERVLWEKLSNKQLMGYKFRRQHPIGDFIADFYCHALKLVIEVDGGYHNEVEQKEYDRGREYDIKELGVAVMRFTNAEIVKDINDVLNRIRMLVTKRSCQLDE